MPLSCGLIDSALTRPILDGKIVEPALDLVLTTGSVDENSRAMIAGKYDIAEMSMATYVQARARGLDLLAIPVFTGRRFLQSCVAFARGSTIDSPSELRGKRIGLPQFWMTAGLWHRGLLEHEYGVPGTQVEWITTQPERFDAGFSPGARVTNVGDQPPAALAKLLTDGTVDVLFTPRPLAADGLVGHLFEDAAATALEYHARTGIYPLLRTIVLKAGLTSRAPALFELFARSKEHAYAHPGANEIPSPIAGLSFDEARERLGDPYPFGAQANVAAIDTFLSYAVEQSLTARRVGTMDAFLALD